MGELYLHPYKKEYMHRIEKEKRTNMNMNIYTVGIKITQKNLDKMSVGLFREISVTAGPFNYDLIKLAIDSP